jgi:hypothetical protein
MTNELPGPIVPPPREGTPADIQRSGQTADSSTRRYGPAPACRRSLPRLLFRWKQELTVATPEFVSVEIDDGVPPAEEHEP